MKTTCLSLSARILISATTLFISCSSNLIQKFFTKVAQQEYVTFREIPLRDRRLLEGRSAGVFTFLGGSGELRCTRSTKIYSLNKFSENHLRDSYILHEGVQGFSSVLSTFLGGSGELRCTRSTKTYSLNEFSENRSREGSTFRMEIIGIPFSRVS